MSGKKRRFHKAGKILTVWLAIGLLMPTSGHVLYAEESTNTAATEQTATTSESDLTVAPTGIAYSQYLKQYSAMPRPDREIVLKAGEPGVVEGTDFKRLENYEGQSGTSLYTGETGKAEWTFQVDEEGLYNISALYFPVEGKSSAIERSLLIDGETPFEQAKYLQFDRVWGNEKEAVEKDNQGNDLRPRQVEHPEWREGFFKDSDGYEVEPFLFYFTKGQHTLTLVSTREPMVISQIKLYQEDAPLPYEKVLEQAKANGMKEATGEPIVIEAEQASAKSSPTLYPQSERSSSAVSPYSASKVRINTIGGYNWRLPGQWIEWEFEVQEEGLYNLSFISQQNFVRGIYSTRKLTIDGKVPFEEMKDVAFKYKSGYRLDKMGGDEPYLFPLTKGKHVLRMEATLGEFAPLIDEVKTSLLNLNSMYRKILMITGSTPDEVRDYRLDTQIPDLLSTFETEKERLQTTAKKLVELSGQTGDQDALLKTMVQQLDEMIKKPDTIPRRLNAYKTNTGGLGTWLQQAREMPLEFDSIQITPTNKKPSTKGMSFFSKLKHEAGTFLYSFFIDYSQIGNVSENSEDAKSITVWIGSGRDQANTIKAMIDESFTPKTGISVNLKLVNMGTLLPATLAGKGPDVAMQIGNDLPVNYAMRNAAADLTQFPDFQETIKAFRDSAMVPYTYRDGVFALPETQTFNMLFYRKDVLQELGLSVPQTWDDVANLLAVLNKNHMDLGLPVVAQAPNQWTNLQPNSMFATLLFQNGGQFYKNDGEASDLDAKVGVEAFKQWTEYYTDYKLEREYDFANRFRTGQMPIGVADYTIYNQLVVFAPEIRGLWGFAPVPGTLQADGTIRRDVPAGGSGTLMLEHAKDKDSAWQFMKWWTSEEAQTLFGREMEGLMGAAARYPTANINALDSLPWPTEDYNNLKAQFEWVRGVPEVPGGYFTGRHLFNAFYKTVVGQKEARETLMDYIQYINDEIRNKREEFNITP
ncbi:extracellular solute-binding protein [Gorillibacterium sp. CAU 1737]|uniref:extracellular solute-binding protein n=1 Tax=Gorillibacterium sp. CAU 1737 TaxID=3140362 RepID=UPI003260598F